MTQPPGGFAPRDAPPEGFAPRVPPAREHSPPEYPPRHLPTPTIWPAVLASGATFAIAGLLTSPLLILFGALLVVVALVGWVSELTREERH